MTRRGRRLLVVALILLGIPLIAAGVIIWYLGSGRLERRVEAEYHLLFPGYLHIGKIEVAGLGQANIRDISLSRVEGQPPVLVVPLVEARGSVMPLRLDSLRVEGVALNIDRQAIAFARELAQAISKLPSNPSVPPATALAPTRVAISLTGTIDLLGILRLANLHIGIDAEGDAVKGEVLAQLGQHPLAVQLETVAAAPGKSPTYRLTLRETAIELKEVFKVLVALDVMDPIPETEPWLPALPVLSGMVLTVDPEAQTISGEVNPVWAGAAAGNRGRGHGTMTIDGKTLVIEHVLAADDELGGGEGRLVVRFADRSLTVDLAHWQPGPRVPIPRSVPTKELIAALPSVHLLLKPENHKTHLSLRLMPRLGTPEDGPHLDLAYIEGQPLRIHGHDLPLTLGQSFVPDWLQLVEGRLATIEVEVDEHLRDLSAQVVAGKVAYHGWTLGPLVASLTVKPVPVAADAKPAADAIPDFAISIGLPMAAISYAGGERRGNLDINIAKLEALLPLLAGPAAMPDLRGIVAISGNLSVEGPGRMNGAIRELRTTGLMLSEVFKDLDAKGSGTYAFADGRLGIKLIGQLQRGATRLPGSWLDVALRTPIFNAGVEIEEGAVTITELLSRSADDQGKPRSEGFTLGVRGKLATDLSGTLQAVVDHADLAWFKTNTTLVPLPPDSEVRGEGAATADIRLDKGAIAGIDGYFLPLDVDVRLPNIPLDITGIKGALRFRLGAATAAEPAVPAPADPKP